MLRKLFHRGGKYHPATSSSAGSSLNAEHAYLRKILRPIVPLLLPKAEGDIKMLTVLVREILVCKVFQPIMSSLADPDVWNLMFDQLAEKLMSESAMSKKMSESLEKLERSDEELDSLDLLHRPPSFDNFIKQIKECDNLLDALGIRDTINTEITKKKTEIGNLDNVTALYNSWMRT